MIVNASRATLLAAAFLLCLGSRAHAQAPDDSKSSSLMRGVDTSINPGDDFFAYANGEWLKKTEIPAGKERWGVRDEINVVAHQRVLKLIDDASSAKAGTLERKVADFRAAYVNESAIESRGLASIKPLLDSINRISDKAALTRMLGHMLPADVDPLNYGVYKSSHVLGLSVEPSIHGEKNYVAFLVQGGLGLDRETYLSADSHMQELRAKYHLYRVGMLSLAGLDNAQQRSFGVVALETALAKAQATEAQSARDRNADTVWTRADFARNAPGMDWAAFFTAARLVNQQTFVPWQPSAVRGLAALVASQPLEAWKDYLRFHALEHERIIQEHRCLDHRSLCAAVVSNRVATIKSKRSQQIRKRLHAAEIIRINHRLHVLHRTVTPDDRHLHKNAGALADGVPNLRCRQTPHEMTGKITSIVRFPLPFETGRKLIGA